MSKRWHAWLCRACLILSDCVCRYMGSVHNDDLPAAAALLGSLAKHLGQRRETSVADAVPALIHLLQSDGSAVESCRTLRCIIESRPAEQSECMRIIAEGGVSKLVACLASEVSSPCLAPHLKHPPNFLPLSFSAGIGCFLVHNGSAVTRSGHAKGMANLLMET